MPYIIKVIPKIPIIIYKMLNEPPSAVVFATEVKIFTLSGGGPAKKICRKNGMVKY